MGGGTPSNPSWFKLLLSGVLCAAIFLTLPEPLFAREHAEYLADRDRYL